MMAGRYSPSAPPKKTGSIGERENWSTVRIVSGSAKEGPQESNCLATNSAPAQKKTEMNMSRYHRFSTRVKPG